MPRTRWRRPWPPSWTSAPDGALALAGQGLRDVTRIAAGDTGLWTQILAANAAHAAEVLAAVAADLAAASEALARIAQGDERRVKHAGRAAGARGSGGGPDPGKRGGPAPAETIVQVVIGDQPGELARLFQAAGEAGVNIEDVGIEHSPACRPAWPNLRSGRRRPRGWSRRSRPAAGRFAGSIAFVTNTPPRSVPAYVIAVDGPAGSGKSTAARGWPRALGLRYLDTGSTYRALTWWLLAHGADMSRSGCGGRHAAGRPVIEVGTDPEAPAIRVDGTDVAGPIRTREVSNAVSAVASVPEVRRHLVAMQQGIIADALAAGAGIVAEGRDIGTAVAPDAPVKVFLTASETVRARRRTAELAADPAATVA